jgi:hypothetical protein
MAGFKLVTDLDPDRALQAAWRAAQDLGFRLSPIEGAAFHAKKGHAVLSAVVGPVSPYCNFKVTAARYGDGTTDVVIETNRPWLTSGMIGVRRVQAQAQELADKVEEALGREGKVMERKEIP